MKILQVFFVLGLISCSSLLGCSRKRNVQIPMACVNAIGPCLQGKAFVKIKTNKGDIVFEIDGNASPITAGNFLDLINKGIYDSTVFHLVIKDPIPFIIKGGDPISKDNRISPKNFGKGSFIDPISGQTRFIPLEIKLKSESLPRYSQLVLDPKELNQIQLTHQKGVIAMSRSKSLDSASSQFYIALKSLPELDGRYSVFGKVIKGMYVLDKIETGDLIIKSFVVK